MNTPFLISRRRLLQTSSAAVAAPWLSSQAIAADNADKSTIKAVGQAMPAQVSLPEQPPKAPADDSVGYAVVGLGNYAINHMMPRFKDAKRAHIAAIVSGNSDKRKKVGDAYGVPEDARYSYEDFAKIADDERVDAIYIVLPSGLHADWTEKAFAAGKHVLCEKPMALSATECQRMIDASNRAKRKLMIAYRCHFEPYNLRAMELMDKNAIGNIRLIRTNQEYVMGQTTPEKNWRANRALAGGGPLEDYGIYGLQSALYLSGEMPQVISAYTHRPANDPRFSQIFSHVGANLEFPSGALAQLFTSYDSNGLNKAMVSGTDGRLLMEPATGYGGHQMTLKTATGSEKLNPGDPQVQFSRQLDHLADAIRDDSKIIVPGEMGLRDVRLMEAIYQSAARGTAVKLKPDGTMVG